MITYRLGFYQTETARAHELIEAIKCHPGCCDTVWLTSMGYYPSLERHVAYADAWVPIADEFRDAGLEVSMQIANTVGHGDWEQLAPERKDPFILGMLPDGSEEPPYLVGPDGKENVSCFCWRSRQLRDYLTEVIKIYAARIRPTRLWFDDDLRAHNHSPNMYGCYCTRCIKEFNRRKGTRYTREELVQKIHTEDVSLRRDYLDFIREGLYAFTYALANACLEVSPTTRFGLEYEHLHSYLGASDEHILGALHDVSGREVHTRPGASHYNDKSPWGQYEKALCLSAANSLLPSYVTECVAEIEDLPGVAFGKSIEGIVTEGTLDLAFGCTGLTFTDVQSCHEPIRYYERIFARIAESRPYWERLSDLSRRHRRGGVSIHWGETPHLMPPDPGAPLIFWDKILEDRDLNLLRLGVPLTYEQDTAVCLLHHSTVDAMTDRDVELLLTRPVITDGESVARLCERGFAAHFALTPTPIGNLSEEHFTESAVNACHADAFYNENPYASVPMQRYVFDRLDERTEVLGNAFEDHFLTDGDELGPCTVLTEIQGTPVAGVRWAIFGYSIWNDIVSAAKRDQILGALDAIAVMPARLRSTDPMVLIPSVDAEGRTVAVTLSAASQSGSGETYLLVRRPRGNAITLMGVRNRTVPFVAEESGKEELHIRIAPLLPYETVTLFFDSEREVVSG